MNESEATNSEFEIVPTIDFSWVCGTDGALSHVRVIDSGGSAEVHEVSAKVIRRLIFRYGIGLLVRYADSLAKLLGLHIVR
jgi:hypothetical protein